MDDNIDDVINNTNLSIQINKQHIKEDYLRFVHFKFAKDASDWKYLHIDGLLFNTDKNYYLYPVNNGFNVQVSRRIYNSICYDYGIMMFIEDGKKKIYIYENGHGPFQ